MGDEERIERLERYCDQLHNRIIDLEREKAREWDVDMPASNTPRPCPFCGGFARESENALGGDVEIVHKDDCYLLVDRKIWTNIDPIGPGTLNLWNRRY